jgi:hypothetical protein
LLHPTQLLRATAASHDELQQAEAHLQQAIAAAEQLSAQQDGLLLESNKACAAEAEDADAARSALAMLLCQSGREDAAAVHLAALGFKFRLSREVSCVLCSIEGMNSTNQRIQIAYHIISLLVECQVGDWMALTEQVV